jgi:hypothetical protein
VTILEFLKSWYFWFPAIFCVAMFSVLAVREKNMQQSYLNHPTQKFQKHDRHYQKKYGIS